MQSMLQDNSVLKYDATPGMTLYYDNLNSINISKNHVQHSRSKHIDILHHFIRILVEDKVIELKHVPTEHQLPDICTKGLDASRFETLLVTPRSGGPLTTRQPAETLVNVG